MTKKTERRAQIYLTADQHDRVMRRAREGGVSLAAVVREALDQYLARNPALEVAPWDDDPFLDLLGSIELPDRGAEKLEDLIDRVVYDEP